MASGPRHKFLGSKNSGLNFVSGHYPSKFLYSYMNRNGFDVVAVLRPNRSACGERLCLSRSFFSVAYAPASWSLEILPKFRGVFGNFDGFLKNFRITFPGNVSLLFLSFSLSLFFSFFLFCLLFISLFFFFSSSLFFCFFYFFVFLFVFLLFCLCIFISVFSCCYFFVSSCFCVFLLWCYLFFCVFLYVYIFFISLFLCLFV